MRVVTLLGKQNLLWFFRQNLCAQYSKGETLVFKHAYRLTWGKVELPCNEKNRAFWNFSSVMKYISWASPIGRQRLYKVLRFHLGFQVSPPPLLDSQFWNQWTSGSSLLLAPRISVCIHHIPNAAFAIDIIMDLQ